MEKADRQTIAALSRLVADRAANPSIHKKKVCLLLGAGADISSGGLSFAELRRQAVEEFLKTPIFDLTVEDKIDSQFDSLFVSLEPDDRALLIESLFRRLQPLRPSDSYKLLVLLTEAGGIDAIVTTNFDLMLEAAQEDLGRDLFQIFSPGLARPYLMSHARFELPKKPYLKLHGDIGSRSVVPLTRDELDTFPYDGATLELLNSILQTHDLIIAGYSGFDTALARVIANAVDGSTNHVFWCNPNPPSEQSPLYQGLSARLRVARIGFDELIVEVARPVLERPSLAPSEPTYINCLFDWRVEYCNREYLHIYGERAGHSLIDVFARRRTIEEQLASFLQPNHPLAIIAGPSGFGKTTIGVRLFKTWRTDELTRVMLIRSRSLPESGDLEQHVCEQLGGLGSRAPFSLFRLERWLHDQGKRLVLFVDGINEFSPDLARCVQLFRNILRLCYFLPEMDSSLRVILTIRQETWSTMLPHLDSAQLRKTLWTDAPTAQSFNIISCGPFTDEELGEAISKLELRGYLPSDIKTLSPSASIQLRDPYLLGILAEAGQRGMPSIPNAALYQRAFESKLQQRGSFIDTATLKDVLASLALKCLESPQERFREIDVQPAALRGEILRLMKDLHIFVEDEAGFLRFDHDRTLEYFLALGFASRMRPSLETLDDLRDFLRHYRTQSKPIAAARLYYQLAPKSRFSVISTGLRLLDASDSRHSPLEREMLFSFCRDVLIEMVEQGEPLAHSYLEDAIDRANKSSVGEHQMRTVVQASANLPVRAAIPLLTQATHGAAPLAQTESGIYAIDKLVKLFLTSGCAGIDLLADEPYATFFADPSAPPWSKIGRLLGFAAQLGPDNSHPQEYAGVSAALRNALGRIAVQGSWDESEVRIVCDVLLNNCDRLLFNATPQGIDRFFGNPNRHELIGLFERIMAGKVLEEADFQIFEPYTQSLASDIEYHLSHVLFVLSSFNDVAQTVALVEQRFNMLSNSTPPEEVDFLEAVLVYLHVLHGLPYDERRYASWEERVLRDWPAVLMYRPGLERGERRGFKDLFDRVFEDGFGVIYAYGTLLPSIRRRSLHYKEYRDTMSSEMKTCLPLYTSYLDSFLKAEKIEEALQILQCISGVIVLWPIEGLLVLRDVVGHPDPRIKRATIRVLAEAFNRHPEETVEFLTTRGVAVSDDDLIEIKIRQDARIGRRQISEDEWARIGHLLLMRPEAVATFKACVRGFLSAQTFREAVRNVLYGLGLINVSGR